MPDSRKRPQRQRQPEKEQDQGRVEAPATMRKGIYLSALIYIEGEQAPAENFNALAKAALKNRLSGGTAPRKDGLTMIIKKLEEKSDVEIEEDGEGEGDAKGEGDRFEF